MLGKTQTSLVLRSLIRIFVQKNNNMNTRVDEAVARKASGRYNCAQAVACTYCDIAGVDEDTAGNIAAAFGVGMGNLEGTCGSLVGAGMVLGLKLRDRAAAMRSMKKLMEKFKAQNGSTICKELKGLGATCPLRACNDCVADAARFLEEELG